MDIVHLCTSIIYVHTYYYLYTYILQTNRFAKCDTCVMYKNERQKLSGNKAGLAKLDSEYKIHLEEIKYVCENVT